MVSFVVWNTTLARRCYKKIKSKNCLREWILNFNFCKCCEVKLKLGAAAVERVIIIVVTYSCVLSQVHKLSNVKQMVRKYLVICIHLTWLYLMFHIQMHWGVVLLKKKLMSLWCANGVMFADPFTFSFVAKEHYTPRPLAFVGH